MRISAGPLSRAVDAAARGPEALLRAGALVGRVSALLDGTKELLGRADVLVTQMEQSVLDVQGVVKKVGDTEKVARQVVDGAADIAQRVDVLVDGYEPVLTASLQAAAHASTVVGPAQVDAFVAYLEFLPLLQALDRDVMPMMSTLQSVAPDLSELLAVSRALNELMGSLPGLRRAKKRMDEELADAGNEEA